MSREGNCPILRCLGSSLRRQVWASWMDRRGEDDVDWKARMWYELDLIGRISLFILTTNQEKSDTNQRRAYFRA